MNTDQPDNTMQAPRPKLYKDKNLRIVFGVTLMVVMGVTSVAPAFPDVLKELEGVTKKNVGLLITFFTLPGVVLTPIMGVLADRFGRKRVLIPSLFLFGVAGFCCGFCRSFSMLLFFRFLQGMGAASLGALNLTIIGDLYVGRERSAALGLNAAVLSMGVATYPVLGGAMAMAGWYFPFFLPVLAIPLGIAVIFSLDTPEPHESVHLSAYFKCLFNGLKDVRILGVFTATLMAFILIYGPFLTYLPVHLGSSFNATPFAIGALMAMAAFSTGLIASQLGRITAYVSERTLLKLSFLMYSASCLTMALMPGLWYFFVPMFFCGLAQGMSMPCVQSILAELAPMEQRAAFMSINAMILRLGQTLGPLIMAIMFTHWGINSVFYAGAVIALLGCVLAFVMVRK